MSHSSYLDSYFVFRELFLPDNVPIYNFQIMSLYIIRCNLPYLSFTSDPWQRVLHEPLPPARREVQDYP